MPRDYIYGLIARPGTTLTPACVGEVMNGEIGSDVPAASFATTRRFIAERVALLQISSNESVTDPIAPWRVEQVLLWSMRSLTLLIPDEGRQTEFKIKFDPDSQYQYIKTMLAFANSGGGYIFFGISDTGGFADFNHKSFLEHDWDSFDQRLSAVASRKVQWEFGVFDTPKKPDLKFDTNLIKKLAEEKGVPESHYTWLLEDGGVDTAQVGVLYTYPTAKPVKCIRASSKKLKKGSYYFRSSRRIESVSAPRYLPNRTSTLPLNERESALERELVVLRRVVADMATMVEPIKDNKNSKNNNNQTELFGKNHNLGSKPKKSTSAKNQSVFSQ